MYNSLKQGHLKTKHNLNTLHFFFLIKHILNTCWEPDDRSVAHFRVQCFLDADPPLDSGLSSLNLSHDLLNVLQLIASLPEHSCTQTQHISITCFLYTVERCVVVDGVLTYQNIPWPPPGFCPPPHGRCFRCRLFPTSHWPWWTDWSHAWSR